jgi:predicted transcriptional regulator
MKVLWDRGPSTVAEVQRALAGSRKLAYTTVQTMLNLLLRKKRVKRVLADRAYVYEAALTRGAARRHAVGDIVDRLFGGSADGLVMSLVEADKLTPADLRRLQKLIEKKGATP